MAHAQHEKKAGHFAEAVAGFHKAAEIAQKAHNSGQQAKALVSLSGCQIRTFQYRQGLASADAGRQLALEAKDDAVAGAAANNRATIYSQVGDNFAAVEAARESVILLRHSSRKDYLAFALLNYGDIQAQLERTRGAVDALQEAVTVAHDAHFAEIEIQAQDHLGDSLIDLNDLAGAEKALNEAFRICNLQKDNDGLGLTSASLAELNYSKRNFLHALTQLDKGIASGSRIVATLRPYWPLDLRGKILLALGRRSEALMSFKQAVLAANGWRRGVLPADATNTRTVVALHKVYQDYVELASELAIGRRDAALAGDAFNTLAENRASSLREEMLSALGQQMRLPPHYFELLANLQATQAQVTLGEDKTLQADKAKLGQIRLELTDLENKIGLHQENFSTSTEKNLHRNSLRDIQRSLSSRALLLSFCLGKDKSFLWAVTRDDMNLYELPAEDKIAAHAKAFSQAVQRGSSKAEGALLTSELFGTLKASAAAKPEWLIAADGALLDGVPFAALPRSARSDAPLTDVHSMRFVPSELLLADAKVPEPQHGFVGVADPIYNLADSRRARTFSFLRAIHAEAAVTLARLVGSEREVRSAAKVTELAGVTILSGSAASSQNLRTALTDPPEVLHFALHVVSPQNQNGSADEAALALSLTTDNMPELLTKEAIATLRVPGSLVVLSGCSSQQGENLPSAGLVGLSRAWLLAGASAVVVSAWPTPDDSGRFFTAFYKHFRSQPAPLANVAQRAANALQQTQLDMQHSSGYRSSPSFWAAYSLISKE